MTDEANKSAAWQVRVNALLTAVGARLREDPPRYAALASLLLTIWLPLFTRSHTADLSGIYTDHIHHPFATWTALTQGIRSVYTIPFAEAWQGSAWPHPLRVWPSVPAMAYPPGVLVLYAPLAVVGRFVPMSDRTFATLAMLYVLVAAHLSFYWVLRLLRVLAPGGRLLVAGFVWLQLMEFGLEGFHDSLVFGLASASIVLGKESRFKLSALAFGAAVSLHYRAGAPFAAIGLWVLVEQFFSQERRALPKTVAVFVAFAVVCAVPLVWSMSLITSELGNMELVVSSTRLRVLVLATFAVFAVLALVHRQWLAAFAGLAAAGLILAERQAFFWHGACVLPCALLVGANTRPGGPALSPVAATCLRIYPLAAYVLLRPIIWAEPADFILRQFSRMFLGA